METRTALEPDISLILPAYNEAATIVNTIRESYRYFESRGLKSQIIVSADGNDGTREKSREIASEIPGLVVIGSAQRAGKGRGIRLGVQQATGRIIGFADADNKVPIDEFDKFLPLLRANAHVVSGSRGFYYFVQTVVGLPGITDSQCGFKFFRHAVAKAVFAKQEIDGYMYDVEILALAIRMGAKLEQVPVRWRDDADSRLDMVAGNIQNVKDIFRIRRRLAAIRPEEYATARQAVANQK